MHQKKVYSIKNLIFNNCCHLNHTERKVILFLLKYINKAMLSLFSLRQIPKIEMFILPPNRWRYFQSEVPPIDLSTLNLQSLSSSNLHSNTRIAFYIYK